MKPTKIEIKWSCSDGSEHKTEDLAKKHEAMLDALRAYDSARNHLAALTVESYKTKDGQPFKMGSVNDYFFVVDYFGIPVVRKVSFWGWYNQKFYLQRDGRLDLIETVGVDQNGSDRCKSFDVSDLYASEKAANAEVAEKKRQLIERLQKEIA